MNIALASFGMSGRVFHAPFIAAHPQLNLYAIVERHRSDSRALYPEAKLLRSVEEMLQDPCIDLVVVNTPIQTHYAYAKAALLAGKNVLVEKPFTVTLAEAQELNSIAIAQQKLLSVYQNRRYDGDYLKVKEVVESGVLGELKEVEIRFDRFRSEISSKAHKESALPGGGALYDLGAHLVDQALQLFGKPKKIITDLGYLRKGTQTDDYFELIFMYDNQLRVRLKSTTFALERQWEYTLHGSEGSFLQQRFDGQEAALVAGATPSPTPWLPTIGEPNGILHTLGGGRELTTAQDGNYWHFYEALYQALIGNGKNPVPAADAIEVIRWLENQPILQSSL
ncbi:Gfo/Idh/MocA family oxidoreductase [Capnocytophaga sp. oral taxon 878]|uniref:Gfo/Idh/MocA family protein n=1 Tax=Capnocytophaga sp. oral taxon 878 TaxID=1316596 RepID=UPI000D034CBB|nr:Gfo/Idh/MocA family oxidoreductase [Capnocytophaga sp. oral taxon 878]AVM50346.1 oxidoreductase [Capnocytophaga sp. oral taxon 878]